jgi:hypothetical protein
VKSLKQIMNLRREVEESRELAKQKARQWNKTAAGSRYVETATATTVVYCPQCKAPVPNSSEGRLGHAQRMPKCREAIRSI